jgi:glycosyltransferase involved in cell wall biosynthesis
MDKQFKKINILMVLPDLSIGGVSLIAIDICNLIDFSKFNIKMLLLSSNTEALNLRALNKDVEVSFIDYEFISDYSLLGYYKYIYFSRARIENLKKFQREVDCLNPDIIHFFTHPVDLNLGYINIGNRSISFLYTDQSVRLAKNQYSKIATLALAFLYRKLFKKFNLISASNTVSSSIEYFKLRAKSKFNVVINNSVDENYFHPGLHVKDQLVAVYVSRITDHKGHEELVKAWSLLKYKGEKKLLMVGPDCLSGAIHKLAILYNVEETVQFLGSTNQIMEILKSCTMGLFPSHKEGLPVALLEKMSMELPVVVSDIPELISIITDGFNGLIFKKGDAIDLAQKIDLLADDFDLQIMLGKNARKTVIEKYSKANEIKEITKIYELINPSKNE